MTPLLSDSPQTSKRIRSKKCVFKDAIIVLVGVALLIAACSRPGSTAGSSALKPIDQAALQTTVDTTARELLVPGAVVLLRTPQGEFKLTYGTALLGTTSPPRADTRFRIASNTKSMTAAVIVQLAQEGKLSLDDPVSILTASGTSRLTNRSQPLATRDDADSNQTAPFGLEGF